MKNIITLLVCGLLFGCSSSKNIKTQVEGYQYKIDLTEYQDDKLSVHLKYKGITTDNVIFCMPKVIPGIYDAVNFGKNITEFKATDQNGNLLPVTKLDENRWQISSPERLEHISYKVADGWDQFNFDGIRPYRSSESSFNSNTFILSTPSLFGYIENAKNQPFSLQVTKPKRFYGATGLDKQSIDDKTDLLKSPNYKHFADNPILYSEPDSSTIKIGNVNIEVAGSTASGKKISKQIATKIKPLIENQIRYFGGVLPTQDYTFLIYQNANLKNNGYYSDGLEHSNSTLILMYSPDNPELLGKQVYQIVSHEFFHTIMPLGLHSFEVANYDFIQPKFSKHLWLYEGTTEYFTIHMQIKNKLQNLKQFVSVIEEKIKEMKKFDDNFSLTKLSLNPIKYQSQYMNVYAKGALLNLCLDIELRRLSNGKYGVQNLIVDLIKKYGVNKPFVDDQLFSEIVKLTGEQSIAQFIEDYIVQGKPLPLSEYLEQVGLLLDTGTSEISIKHNLSTKQAELRYAWINQ